MKVHKTTMIPAELQIIVDTYAKDIDRILETRPVDTAALWLDMKCGDMGVITLDYLQDLPKIVREDIPTKSEPGAWETWWMHIEGVENSGWVRFNRYSPGTKGSA